MLRALDDLIERRIAQAQRDGEFEALPGAGRPLADDAQPLVPEEVRAAYRVLRNAGLVPPEVDALRQLAGQAGRSDLPPSRATALTVTLERRGLRLAQPGVAAYAARIRERLAGAGSTEAPCSGGEPVDPPAVRGEAISQPVVQAR